MSALNRTNYPGWVILQFLIKLPNGAGFPCRRQSEYPSIHFAMVAAQSNALGPCSQRMRRTHPVYPGTVPLVHPEYLCRNCTKATTSISRHILDPGKLLRFRYERKNRVPIFRNDVDYHDNANRVRPNALLESAASTPGYTRHCNPVAAELPGKNVRICCSSGLLRETAPPDRLPWKDH
jgi:hypothetical protein